METYLPIINLILLIITIVLVIILIKKSNKTALSNNDIINISKTVEDKLRSSNGYLYSSIEQLIKSQNITINENSKNIANLKYEVLKEISEQFKSINTLITNNNEKIINELKYNLENIRKDNSEKLDKIQGVVDEKLQKTLEERLNNSFNNVLEQIGGVNKAIGEIKGIATDVSSLKTVLTNVKTKGIMGEVLLGNLIREILSPTQFDENVITKVGSTERVEFAIKMPGTKGEGYIYLPVDSKFPTENYNRILEASNQNDKVAIDNARKMLLSNIKDFAKDISTKYIDEPNTTGFAIMFLPIEGLYAEVINLGIFEELQRDYKVIITGPSTFSALLNALQMGFKTLIIQKKSADVFKLLTSVKTEFSKFAELLEKTQKKVNDAGEELEKLVGTRTRAIQRKLRDVESLPEFTDNNEIENQ